MAAVPPVPPVLPQPQPPAPQQLVGPWSYLEYYTDAANDPWARNYSGLMGQYSAIPANTLEVLLTRMLSYAPSSYAGSVHHAGGTNGSSIVRPDDTHASADMVPSLGSSDAVGQNGDGI